MGDEDQESEQLDQLFNHHQYQLFNQLIKSTHSIKTIIKLKHFQQQQQQHPQLTIDHNLIIPDQFFNSRLIDLLQQLNQTIQEQEQEELVQLITQELIDQQEQSHLAKPLIQLYQSHQQPNQLIGNILINWGKQQPKQLFTTINHHLFNQQQHQDHFDLGTLELLIDFLSHQPYSIHSIRTTPLLHNLHLSLIIINPTQTNSLKLKLTIDAILLILPRLSSLIGYYLPYLFLALTTILCSSTTHSVSSPPSFNSLDHHLSLDHSILNLFNFLYGIAPCNLIEFLRNPIDLLHSFSLPNTDPNAPEPIEAYQQLQEAIQADIQDLIPVDQLKNLVLPLMDRHRLNKNIILMTPSSERKEISHRLKMYEPAELIEKCQQTLIVSGCELGSEGGLAELLGRPTDLGPSSSPSGEPAGTPKLEETNKLDQFSQISLTSPVLSQRRFRPAGPPVYPQLQLPSAPPPVEDDRSIEPHDPPPDILPNTDTIDQLRIQNRLLRSQLLVELYLKSQHLQQLGSVHKQNILGAGLEAENQNLLRMNKELRKKLSQSHESKQETQSSKMITNRNKLAYQELIKKKNLELKKDNLGFLNTKFVLLNQINELEKAVELQNRNFLLVQSEAHELKNQLTLIEPQLRTIEGLEARTASLSKALLIWDDDLRRFREARTMIERLRSQWKKALSESTCHEIENHQLRLDLQSQQDRIGRLETENAWLRRPSRPIGPSNPNTTVSTIHRIHRFRDLVDQYRAHNLALRNRLVQAGLDPHVEVEVGHHPTGLGMRPCDASLPLELPHSSSSSSSLEIDPPLPSST